MRRRAFTAVALKALALTAASTAAGATTPSAAPSVPLAASYFGMHFHRLFPLPNDRTTTRWPDAAIGSLRLWDTSTRWADVAPRRDRWDFARLDAHVALAETHGATLLCTLGSTPRWASARPDEPGPYGPGCAAEPTAVADWHEYVERIVTRYRGRIGTYEVWNEPYFSDLLKDRGQPTFFSGSVAQMIEMTRIVRSAIDRIDPAARLATPGFVNGTHRLDLFLAQGGARYVDLVAYHFYAADAAQLTSQAAEVRAVMARRGVASMPLWNTEAGVEQGEGAAAGAELAADRLAQFLVLGAAVGLERYYYHAWDNGLTGMVDRAGVLNARAPAYERVQQWLIGAATAAPARLPGGGYRIDAARGAARVVIAWSDGGEPFTPVVAAGLRLDAIEPLRGAAFAPRAPVVLTSMPVAFTLRAVRDAAT